MSSIQGSTDLPSRDTGRSVNVHDLRSAVKERCDQRPIDMALARLRLSIKYMLSNQHFISAAH